MKPRFAGLNDKRIEPIPESGCLVWTGSTNGGGYGQVMINWRAKRVHRVVWEMVRGPIPEGMVLDHVCRVRSCVNPDHLRIVTPRENAVTNSTGFAATNAQKTECPRCFGAYAVSNAVAKFGRYCPECKKTSNNRTLRERTRKLRAARASEGTTR